MLTYKIDIIFQIKQLTYPKTKAELLKALFQFLELSHNFDQLVHDKAELNKIPDKIYKSKDDVLKLKMFQW